MTITDVVNKKLLNLENMKPWEISDTAKRINKESLFIDVHNHMMFEFAIREALGEKNIFDNHYLEPLRKGGINVIATSVGANSPCLSNLTDYLEFGAFEQIDMLYRAEKESNSFKICTNVDEINSASKDGKIGIVLAFEGARALEGRSGEESLTMLRIFHKLGLRINCICGAARTMFGDGAGETADAGLTTFGVKLVEEMNKIGMLIDLTHMTDRTFFDVMDTTNKPVLVSHTGVKKISNSDGNLSDERILAIGKNRGIMGMQIVKTEMKIGSHLTGEVVTFDNVVDHIDHISSLIGPEHICIGLDYDNFDLVHNVHRAMAPFPGSIEGFYTGIPKGDHMLNNPKNLEESYVIAEYLLRRGYSEEHVRGILGENLMRVFKETLI